MLTNHKQLSVTKFDRYMYCRRNFFPLYWLFLMRIMYSVFTELVTEMIQYMTGTLWNMWSYQADRFPGSGWKPGTRKQESAFFSIQGVILPYRGCTQKCKSVLKCDIQKAYYVSVLLFHILNFGVFFTSLFLLHNAQLLHYNKQMNE